MKKSNRLQVLTLPLGVLLILSNLGNPRVAALHGSDVLKLIASGFLLGIGLASLVDWLKPGSFNSSTKDQS
jgi:hypothetical protein